MAVIQLGNGSIYGGHIYAYNPFVRTNVSPSKIVVSITTDKKGTRRNFPISVDLSRDEAVELLARVATALMPPTLPVPQGRDGKSELHTS